MTILLIRQVCIVLHLTGLVLMVGHTVADFFLFRSFSRRLVVERTKSLVVLELMSKLSLLMIAGAVLLIGSGTGLFFVAGGVFGEQAWFQVKMALVLVLIVNGSFFGGRLQAKLKKLLNENGPEVDGDIKAVNGKLRLFYTMQLVVFFTIIVLAVFKFN